MFASSKSHRLIAIHDSREERQPYLPLFMDCTPKKTFYLRIIKGNEYNTLRQHVQLCFLHLQFLTFFFSFENIHSCQVVLLVSAQILRMVLHTSLPLKRWKHLYSRHTGHAHCLTEKLIWFEVGPAHSAGFEQNKSTVGVAWHH